MQPIKTIETVSYEFQAHNAGPNSLSKIHGIVQVIISRRQRRTRRKWLGVDDDGAEDDGEAVCVGVCKTEKNMLAPARAEGRNSPS